MTWITDDTGTRWVEAPPRKKRALGKRRFEDVKVGDYVMRDRVSGWTGNRTSGSSKSREYAVVTDLWFDPVKGQREREHGEMVAIRWIMEGVPVSSKWPHTLRGLATNGYTYADRDPVAEHAAKVQAQREGVLVGIGQAHVIRRRPKQPGGGI